MWVNLEVNNNRLFIIIIVEISLRPMNLKEPPQVVWMHDYEVVAEVNVNKMEAPHSDDGDGFNLNKCAAYKCVSTPHGRN